MRAPTVNPVLARELRQRMRGPRTSVVITLYLSLLSFVVWMIYRAASQTEQSFNGPDIEQVASLGRSVFQTLLFLVLMLVCFIVPGQTAAAISGERERQTLVPLQVTLLRSRSILFGKLLASLAFVVLLIVATVPLAGVAFMLGGVEPLEVIRATLMLLVVAAVLAAIALLCSTLMRRTQGATVLAYGVVLALTIGTFAAFGAQSVLNRNLDTDNQAVLQVNPFMAVADVLDDAADENSGGSSFSPFTPMQSLLRDREQASEERFTRGERAVIVGPDGLRRLGPRPQRDAVGRGLNAVPFVVFSLLAYAGIAAGSLALAARRLHVPRWSP